MATSLTVAILEILLSEFCHDWQSFHTGEECYYREG